MAKKLKPFFSIVIPTLNEEKYLPNLLTDLSKQSFRDFEVIVVDGNSDDKTMEKAKSYLSSLPALSILTSSTRHVCTQRNLGAANAKADWLIFMDADNRLPPYFLQGIKYRLESNTVDIASCYLQNDNDNPRDKNIAQAINLGTELLKNTDNPQIMEALVISSRRAFQLIGGFNENVHFSEGRVFAARARGLGLNYHLFKDPTYTYSFRRIRKYGLLNLTSRLAKHELALFFNFPLNKTQINRLYPMKGGRFFDSPARKRRRFIKKITLFLQQLQDPHRLKSVLTKLLED